MMNLPVGERNEFRDDLKEKAKEKESLEFEDQSMEIHLIGPSAC
jgi:hypothetical protein